MRKIFVFAIIALLGCASNKPPKPILAVDSRCSTLFIKPANFDETNYTEVPDDVECTCLEAITCNGKEYCELIDCPGYTNPYSQ